ncbi:hypothetical protein DFH09DRAFT_1314185 [Mycena vulgaris]|nr:hypothetical protein DFH09DRAFT_1314185 [Mycena vulgaris]
MSTHYRLHTSYSSFSASRVSRRNYDAELQKKNLHAAIHDDEPIEYTRPPPTNRFLLTDGDPSVARMRQWQHTYREANRWQDFLTFDRERNDLLATKHPSLTLMNGDVKFIAPSSYHTMAPSFFPLCPHYGNLNCTTAECRMTPHTHRDSNKGAVYLQVNPKEFHHCPFILITTQRQMESSTDVSESSSSIRPLRAMQTVRSTRPSSSRIKLEDVPTSSPAYYRPVFNPSTPVKTEAKPERSSPPLWLSRSQARPRTQGSVTVFRGENLYSAEEAQQNKSPDQEFMKQMRNLLIGDFMKHPEHHPLADEDSPEFPAAFAAFRSEASHRARIVQYSHAHAIPFGRVIRDLTSTIGVPPSTMDRFKNHVVTCHSCGLFFTPDGFRSHLELAVRRDVNVLVCAAMPARDIVAPLAREPVELPLHQPPVAYGPGQVYAVPQTVHLHTPTGIAFLALNTCYGVPEDIWVALRSSIIICETCLLARSVPAHAAHLDQGICCHVGRHEVSVILSGKGNAKAKAEGGTMVDVTYIDSDNE